VDRNFYSSGSQKLKGSHLLPSGKAYDDAVITGEVKGIEKGIEQSAINRIKKIKQANLDKIH
jgi:hypothetical protein